MIEGRARESGQLAGFGGVYAGPPVEVLGTVGGSWRNFFVLKQVRGCPSTGSFYLPKFQAPKFGRATSFGNEGFENG